MFSKLLQNILWFALEKADRFLDTLESIGTLPDLDDDEAMEWY